MKTQYYSPRPNEIQDWHPADIVAALRKAGSQSLRQLAVKNGYASGSLSRALRTPWYPAQAIIADAIGIHPMIIWPTRYKQDGSPNPQAPGRKKSCCQVNNSIATDKNNA